jgi:predicted metal-dependent phosphotriesterase family hydrolase
MTTNVMTVRGPVPADHLGFTLPHEHVFTDLSRPFPAELLQFDFQLLDEGLAVTELRRFTEAAAAHTAKDPAARPCLFDLTLDRRMGRNPEALKRVAEALDLHIVMGCGWYREPWFAPDFARTSTRELADLLTREIEQGSDGTGVRPGIIGELGADHDVVSPAEERALRAAARAHARTGLTITLHARASRVGMQQLDILEEEGVAPDRVIVGHTDSYPYPDYHEALAKRGAWVEFDTIRGKFPFIVERSVRYIKEATRRGYLGQVLLAGDVCALSHLRAYGGTGYDYIPGDFMGVLRGEGYSQEQLYELMVLNPRRAITGAR